MSEELWLLRVPDSLGKDLAQLSSGASCGTIESSGGRLRLRSADGDEFLVDELRGGPQLLAFRVEEAQAQLRRYSVQGGVSRNLTLKPADMAKYMAQVKRRQNLAPPRPSTQQCHKVEALESSIIDFAPPVAVQMRVQAEEQRHTAKRARAEGDGAGVPSSEELRGKIFEAFKGDGSGRVLLKTLGAFCRATYPLLGEKELKEELEKHATYIRKGPNKGTWQLRSDFR
jgi:hypothetical protein